MELPTTLLGRYELEEVVGIGGMGTVVRARDSVLDRTVAVKLLKPELSTDGEMVERFRREARIAAALSHPGIAQVYDFAEEHGRVFIVMEHLEGEDLHSILDRHAPLDNETAVAVAADCAEALEAAHLYGAVHRDVKPGNIFLTTTGRTKLTDFGIARAASQAAVTATGSVFGTSLYIAPEQAAGEPTTPASDIYSLGCVLFEMVTGRAPFQAESQIAVAMAHINEEPPRAVEINSDVPPDLDALIGQAMKKDPKDRFSSAGAMAKRLRSMSDARVAVAELVELPQTASPYTEVIARSTPPVSTAKLPPTTVDSLGSPKPPREPIGYEGDPDKRRRRVRLLAIAALVLLIALLAAFRLVGFEPPAANESETVKLPSFVGSTIEAAEAQAKELGINVRKDEKPSDRPIGEVVDQDPDAGTVIRSDVVVTLAISIGPRETVPDVRNQKLEKAEETLEKQGFQVQVEGPNDGDATVIGQSPEAGAQVPPGSEIKLTTESEDKKRGRGRGGDD